MHASHEALTRRSPWLTLLARCECLKRHGVGEREGELGANFSSIVMPRMNSPWHIVPEPGGVGGHFARTSDPRNRRNAKETETRSVATGHNSLWTLCKFR